MGRGDGASLRQIAALFLRLGSIAFGGPAAHVAMMEEEFVERRRWLTRQHFLDLLGATNLIPGPNSTEMTMHVGYERAGPAGLVVAGVSFITPAALITLGFAWAYAAYGSLPQVEPFLHGIKPAMVAVILGAVWKLGRKAVKGWRLAVIGAAVTAAVLAGAPEVPALAVGGFGGMLWLRFATRGSAAPMAVALLPPLSAGGSGAAAGAALGGASLAKLGLFFLKVGAVLYGSGYVLIAFLEGDLVERYGWLTQDQLLDAVAVGQLTPGPVLSTATFVGYLVAGAPGAGVATVAIFLPSFLFVLLLNPLIPRLRQSKWAAAFLDAVNVSALGLMIAVTVHLGRTALAGWQGWLIALLAAAAYFRLRPNPAWLVLGGALAGYLLGGP